MTKKTKLFKLNRKTGTVSEALKGFIVFSESCDYCYVEYEGSSINLPIYTPEDGHGIVTWREPKEKPPLGLRPRSIAVSLRI